ncbi:MAG: hypothetical protein ACLVJH_17810 [Faecalibacterium prausnitzii]
MPKDAVGQVLCHDITRDHSRPVHGARFRKGHIVQPEDIPVLLSTGKENLYVWEKRPGILHDGREPLPFCTRQRRAATSTALSRRKARSELVADLPDGLLKIRPRRPAGREPHTPNGDCHHPRA